MKKTPLKRVLNYLKPYSGLAIVCLLGSAAYSVCALLVPVFVGKIVDLFVGVNAVDFGLLRKNLAVIGGLVITATVCQYLQGLCNNRIAFFTVMKIRNDIIEKMQKIPLSYFDAKPSGEIVSGMIADAEALSDGLLLAFSQLFTGIITITGTIIMMFVYNPVIALIVIALTPISLLSAKFITSKTHKKFAVQAKLKAEQTTFIEETVGNNKTIKAYSQEKAMEERFAEIDERLTENARGAMFFSSLTNPTTRFVNALVYAMVALVGGLCAAGTISIGKAITAGVLTCLLNYAGQYAKPFNEISGVIAELQASAVGANRIFSLLDEEEEIHDKDGEEIEAKGEVEAKNVSFSYDKSKSLIKDFNLRVESGKHVAIVGPTGCGKTTLINLLMRFYDVDGGEIAVDGKNIKSLTRKSLRDSWGMVLQDSWIRKATIRENLTLGGEISDERIAEATKLCKTDGIIARFKDGLNAEISEESLSQGEKQLLCITRVMLSEPKMLILDEATSAVDVRTETKINRAFDLLMEGKTSFIVAHRLSTIKHADLILVMKDGNVIDEGTHEELLAKGGFYKDLYYGSLSK